MRAYDVATMNKRERRKESRKWGWREKASVLTRNSRLAALRDVVLVVRREGV
jgi:hypothetical protein